MLFFISLALSVPLMLWQGIVILSLWKWFVLPLNAPMITLSHAIGLSIFIRFFTSHYSTRENEIEDMVNKWVYAFIYPLTGLFFGYIVHFFM